MLIGLRKVFRKNLGIDLGTANTLIYLEDEGIVFNEPTAVARSDAGKLLAVGSQACSYLGRTPEGIEALRPMARGVISDYDAVSSFLHAILNEVRDRQALLSPDVVVCVPSNITRTEQRTVLDAVMEADVHRAWLMEEVMAAAVGAGVAGPDEPPAMVLDIGGGTSEAAIISDMAYLACETLRVAGDDMNEQVARYMKRKRGLVMSISGAEKIKWDVGCVLGWKGGPLTAQAGGKDIVTGLPTTCEVTSTELAPVFEEIVENIVELVKEVMRQVDVEVLHHVVSKGAVLTGGGSMLRGLASYLSDRCGIRFHIAENPLETVIEGAGTVVQDIPAWRSVFVN